MDMTLPAAIAVDRLGDVKARIADLTAEAKELEAQIVAAGVPVVEGRYFRAAVSHCEGRVSVDWKSIAAKFEPSRQLVTAHTSQGAPYDVVRVSARKVA